MTISDIIQSILFPALGLFIVAFAAGRYVGIRKGYRLGLQAARREPSE